MHLLLKQNKDKLNDLLFQFWN